MGFSEPKRSGRGALVLVLATAVLAACAAHGQKRSSELKRYPGYNYTSHSAEHTRALLSERIYVFRAGAKETFAQLFRADGSGIRCEPGKAQRFEWSVEPAANGTRIRLDWQRGFTGWWFPFYDAKKGLLRMETLNGGIWVANVSGQVQESWPRAFADLCPGISLPAGISINEKQTSANIAKLRRQDPDAPIRNFPGSQLTAPGRTGLGKSEGRTTTSHEETWSWLQLQEGYVLTSADGVGNVVVLAKGGKKHEVWRLAGDGSISGIGVLRDQGDWATVEAPDLSEPVK